MKRMKKFLLYSLSVMVIMTYPLPQMAFADDSLVTDQGGSNPGISADAASNSNSNSEISSEVGDVPSAATDSGADKADDGGIVPDTDDSSHGDSNVHTDSDSEGETPLVKPDSTDMDSGNADIGNVDNSLNSTPAAIEEAPILLPEEKAKEISIQNETFEFHNGDHLVDPDGDTPLDPKLGFKMKGTFEIDDDTVETIQDGDFTKISFDSQGIDLKDFSTTSVYLNVDGNQKVKIGTLSLENGEIKITYNDEFSNLKENGLTDVTLYYNMALELDQQSGGDQKPVIIKIGDTTYTFYVQKQVEVNLVKKGTFDKKTGLITWTLSVTPKQLDTLAGYVLTDPLPSQLKYVEGSFKVNGKIETEGLTIADNPNRLTYTFPQGSIAEKTDITFETQFLSILDYNNKEVSVTNKATIVSKDGSIKKEASDTVKFTPKWIVKKGSYQDTKGQISWTLNVNGSGFSLKNVVITDVLDPMLTVAEDSVFMGKKQLNKIPVGNSSKVAKPCYGITTTTSSLGEQQVLNIYLGDISEAVNVTFRTNVDKDTIEFKPETVKNTATLSWDSFGTGEGGSSGSIGSNQVTVSAGVNAINKKAVNSDRASHEITWQVNANARNQGIDKARAIDCFVATQNGAKFNGDANFMAALNKVAHKEKALDPGVSLSKASLNQSYVEGSFKRIDKNRIQNDDGMKYNTFQMTYKGQQLTVGILTVDFGNIDRAQKYEYKTTVLKYLSGSNKEETLSSDTYLYSGTKYLTDAGASCNFRSHVIEKDFGPDNNNNRDYLHYNYEDQTAEWWIHVNANKMAISDAVVTDTIPKGFEVYSCPAYGDTFFQIYEGGSLYNYGFSMNTSGSALNSDDVLMEAPTVVGNQVTFKFKPIPEGKGYVIKLMTHLTEEGGQQLFTNSKDQTKDGFAHVKNDAKIKGKEIMGTPNDWEDLYIKNILLNKLGEADAEDGTIHWKITANSNRVDLTAGQQLKEVAITDQLPEYLSPVFNKDGSVQATVFQVVGAKLNGDPSKAGKDDIKVIIGNALPSDVVKEHLHFDKSTNTLKFTFPDIKGGYQLVFTTSVDKGKLDGESITNHASLMGTVSDTGSTSNVIKVSELDAGGSANSTGKITITKVKQGDSGTRLSNAVFELYQVSGSDENPVLQYLATGATNEEGIVQFKKLKSGTYRLVETQAPEGYQVSSTPIQEIQINVKESDQRNIAITIENPVKDPAEPSRPGGGGGHSNNTPDQNIPEEEIPGGAIDSDGEETVNIEDEQVPGGAIPAEEATIFDEPIPAGSIVEKNMPMLPKTGGVNAMYFYGIGAGLTALGLYLQRRKTKKRID